MQMECYRATLDLAILRMELPQTNTKLHLDHITATGHGSQVN